MIYKRKTYRTASNSLLRDANFRFAFTLADLAPTARLVERDAPNPNHRGSDKISMVERDAPNPNHRGSDKISMVEARRIELLSKELSVPASPSAVSPLKFPHLRVG